MSWREEFARPSGRLYALVLMSLILALSGCERSEEEEAILLEDTYNQGYFDALDCVKRKGGSAYSAASDCENE
jgi:hypothetical protein